MAKKFIVVWNMEFTIFEEFILKVIEKKKGCSDEDIAETLSLDVKLVGTIVRDIHDDLNGIIQGDESRRTLKDGFIKKEYAIIDEFDLQREREQVKQNKTEVKQSYDKKVCEQKHLDIIMQCKQILYNELYDTLKDLEAWKYYILNDDSVSSKLRDI